MYIIFCDDDIAQAKGFCTEFAELLSEHTLKCCASPQFIFEEIEKGSNPDAVLMDIDLGMEKNGIDYAQKLHSLSPKTRLILVTAYTEKFVQDAFFRRKNIAAFLIKPIQQESLLRALFDHEENTQDRKLSFQHKGEIISLSEDEIVYLESNKHYVIINAADGTVYSVQGKLSEYERSLSDVFLKCHKSFSVNMGQIKKINSDTVHLINGKQIPVSRSCSGQVKTRFLDFLEKK